MRYTVRQDGSYVWNWEADFSAKCKTDGRCDWKNGRLKNFSCDPNGRWAKCKTESGFYVEVTNAPTTVKEIEQYPNWDSLSGGFTLTSSPRYFKRYYSCECSQGTYGARCRHLASLMYEWEAFRGGSMVINESEEVRQERRRKLEEERLRKLKEAEIQKKKDTIIDTDSVLARYLVKLPAGLTFNPDRLLNASNIHTTQYENEMIADVMRADSGKLDLKTEYDSSGKQKLVGDQVIQGFPCSMTFTQTGITSFSCRCGRHHVRSDSYYYYRDNRPNIFCAHLLGLFVHMREQIIEENPGDFTDSRADKLLSLLAGESEMPAVLLGDDAGEKGNLVVVPRILRDNKNELKLGFDVGRAGGKTYAVKGLEKLVVAVEGKQEFALTKTATVNFATESFSDSSLKWYRMISSRVRSVHKVNDTLNRSNNGYYYYSSTKELSVGSGIPLAESDLDMLYDMACEEGEIRYQYGGRANVDIIPVGEMTPRISVKLSPRKEGEKLLGVEMEVSMPEMLQGSQHAYILDFSGFGRVSDKEIEHLRMFRRVVGSTERQFKCTIGEKRFPEFFYRILPMMQKAGDIELENKLGNNIEKILPPQAEFTFYVDLTEDEITCRTEVRYDDQVFLPGFPSDNPGRVLRDTTQESRAVLAVMHFFDKRDEEKRLYKTPADEEKVLAVMTDGVTALSSFGEVKGSSAFHRINIRTAPQPRLVVRIDSGLLDLSIQTKDLSEDELLDLLNNYKMRKRWYRLKNGDYVNLRDSEGLEELNEAIQSMDIDITELVHGGTKLPLYRSLYVDKLLESHDKLVASRNREFKALIRSFQTIRDSDFEVPEGLAEIVRPYQQYGFRWLCTLAQSGFGGILADEMGLGKTLQLLAVLQMKRDSGETRPYLVVCPASVVYNWKEECRRFIPNMPVNTLADTLPYRKKMLQSLREGNGDGVYITSYDLLKRDITLYDGVQFAVVALDEAQYVKNAHTAVAKAVKVLQAEQRYALTGTPIENRLSELWSIFDFLMPGFLYSNKEFVERFETPIMKKKDMDATDRLARMTEPFILRRKKADVLKDLPDKLEETQSVEMEDEQRKLYDAQVVHMRELLAGSGESGEDKMRILAEITRLRQICCDPSLLFENYSGASAKREACIELIQNAIDGGHRMLVFSQFTSMLSLLEQDLRDNNIPFFLITGATAKQERLRLVNEFNDGDVPVFLISLKAGGTGLNLTGADVVIHYDPWWNLAVQNQATDRAHRIGQTRQVTVIKLITSGTIEEKIAELQEAKRELADAIISGEGSSLMSLSREELLALID